MKQFFLKIPLIAFLSIMFLNSCTKKEVVNFQGNSLGTYYSITYIGEENPQLPEQVDSILAEISHQFSIFDTTSILFRINRGDSIPFTTEMEEVFQISKKVSDQTNGAFDITVGPLVNLWGFGKEKREHIDQKEIDSVMSFVGYTKMELKDQILIRKDPRIQLNFNAIAKGYAVDQVAHFLIRNGYPDCIVDIGGEVVSKGTKDGKQWQIGIQTPTESSDGAIDAQYVFPMKNKAVATSGNYRNYIEKGGERYSHIINPKTGKPEHSSLLSVSVIADDCVTADAYSTAFMVLGMEKSLAIVKKNPRLAVYFIYDKKGKFEVKKSPNFP